MQYNYDHKFVLSTHTYFCVSIFLLQSVKLLLNYNLDSPKILLIFNV